MVISTVANRFDIAALLKKTGEGEATATFMTIKARARDMD